MVPANFDFKSPDYNAVFQMRATALENIRANPEILPGLKAYYKENIAQFITDWGCTLDPKQVELNKPSLIPFILYPKQVEWVDAVVEHWHAQKPLLTVKARQLGFSWASIAVGCSLCLFNEGMSIGYGSRKEIYVDCQNDNKSLFQKARVFLSNLPVEFRGGWELNKHAPHMRIIFPHTGASMTGEAGDNIGRGNTTSIYFCDESAFYSQPLLIESSLSQTTNCRVDISTPNGMQNPFAEKVHGGKIDVIKCHWSDDPRRDTSWYLKQCEELDPVTIAQELDIDFQASVSGVVIPVAWIKASVDAHLTLQISPTGKRSGALDVADEGKDMNAFCGRHGISLEYIDEWSGKGSDIFKTTYKAFDICDAMGYELFKYDQDGLGAGVRGDARIIASRRAEAGQRPVEAEPFRGSEAVFNPEGEDVKGRKNKDYFQNRKAQAWWNLRRRFERTYGWVVEGRECDPDEIISINSNIKHHSKLISELSQPTYIMNDVGKIVINKAPDNTKSPNLADAVMIAFSTTSRPPIKISAAALAAI